MTKTEKINFKKMQISEIKDFLVHLEEYQKTSDETWLDIDPDTGIKACDDTSDGEHYSHFDRIYTCLEDYMKILQDEIDELEKECRYFCWWELFLKKVLAVSDENFETHREVFKAVFNQDFDKEAEIEKKLEPVDFAEIYGAAKLARVVSEM